MKYKALFLDLDGTTIPNRPDGMPSKRVAEAIHRAKPFVHVCVVTSRPLFIASSTFDHLDINGLCIVNDATQIYDPIKKKFIQTIFIESQRVPNILAIAVRYGMRALMNSGKSERVYPRHRFPKKICSIYIGDLLPDKAEELVAELTKIPNLAVHKMLAWKKGYISISVSHASATKLYGVQRIAKILGISHEEMIGVGDGYNDFPLLMACGLKIAMGNAVPELKAIADFIAPSVEEDGVATVIEKFILS